MQTLVFLDLEIWRYSTGWAQAWAKLVLAALLEAAKR
jgi:hypothetical protein